MVIYVYEQWFYQKNIRLAAIITILIGICGIFAWINFPITSVDSNCPTTEVIAQIDRIQSDRDALLGQKSPFRLLLRDKRI